MRDHPKTVQRAPHQRLQDQDIESAPQEFQFGSVHGFPL